MKIIINIIVIFLTAFPFKNYAQDVTKISMTSISPGTPIAVSDIAYAGHDATGPRKAIGYNFLTQTGTENFGILVIDNSHNVLFNLKFALTNTDVVLLKIIAENAIPTSLYLLIGIRISPFSSLWEPAIVKINNTNGNIIWSKKIDIPNISSFTAFFPKDIFVGTTLEILCETQPLNPSSGTPVSKILKIEFDPSTFSYTSQEFYNSQYLNSYFRLTKFVKNNSRSLSLVGKLSISGILDNGLSAHKGFIYVKDNNNNEYHKLYTLNNDNTIAIQTNGYDGHINIALQNAQLEIVLEKFASGGLLRKYYKDASSKFIISNSSHGIKGSDINSNDFMIGYYGDPLGISNSNGYGYFRFGHLNNTINQSFWYDLSFPDFSSMNSLYDDISNQCSFVFSAATPLGSSPFIYLSERDLSSSMPICTNTIGIQEQSYNLSVEDEIMTVIDNSTLYASSTIDIPSLPVRTSLSSVCTEQFKAPIKNYNTVQKKLVIHFSRNMLSINSIGKEIKEVTLFGVNGVILQKRKYTAQSNIEMQFSSALPSGIYLIKTLFSDNSTEIQKKIIVFN